MTNQSNDVLYVGVTNDLVRRVQEHCEGLIEGFTQRYNVKKLVYFERHSDIAKAIKREKTLKKWARVKKERLIEMHNALWSDLSKDLWLL